MNNNLRKAKAAKNDEFYTQLSDIENELRHYTEHFAGKVVYCNCDDPRVSSFFHFFSYNFERLGLKGLVTACYRNQERDLFSRHDSEQAIWLEYKGNKRGDRVPDIDDIGIRPFKGDGDFRSAESIELLEQADVVVTNPPFSLFRQYVAQLMEYRKKFLIVGSQNAVTYKEIFPLIKDNRMWLGVTPKGQDMLFDVPKGYAEELAAVAHAWHDMIYVPPVQVCGVVVVAPNPFESLVSRDSRCQCHRQPRRLQAGMRGDVWTDPRESRLG